MFIERKVDSRKETVPFIITFSVILACLILNVFFPAQNAFQEITKSFFFLVLIPAAYIRYVLKSNWKEFGFNIQEKRTGLVGGAIMIIVFAAILFVLLNYSPLPDNYSLSAAVIDNFWYFLIYELVLANLFLFMNQFFFSGFVLLVVQKKLPIFASLIVPVAFYSLTLIVAKSFSWQTAPSVILIFLSSFLAMRSRSFIYPYAVSLVATIIFDAYLIHALK